MRHRTSALNDGLLPALGLATLKPCLCLGEALGLPLPLPCLGLPCLLSSLGLSLPSLCLGLPCLLFRLGLPLPLSLPRRFAAPFPDCRWAPGPKPGPNSETCQCFCGSVNSRRRLSH